MTTMPPLPGTSALPFRVCGVLNSRSFGDYILQIFTLSSIAAQFDHSEVTLLYRQDQGFRPDIVSMIPGKTFVIAIPANDPYPTLDIFDSGLVGSKTVQTSAYKDWFAQGLYRQDFILTDTMVSSEGISGFPRHGYLTVPPERRAECETRLLELGLKPNKWFCTIHYREGGYKYKPAENAFRNSPPENFLALTNYVIDKLGGQVVRLGHPQMTEFPAREGFVDLSRFDDVVMLQAYAVARSRFLIAGPSGGTGLGPSQGVPLGHADAVDFNACVHAQDVIRSVDVITPSGEVLNQRAMMDAGLNKLAIFAGLRRGENYQIIKNSPEILAQMANWLYETTENRNGWHEPKLPTANVPRPNTLSWPLVPKMPYHFL